MKRIVLGVLAHVDSGKTTLSEALLYKSGKTKNLGRVDHKDAYLDTKRLERERGITIFSKQALFAYNETEITLMDTPGHVDFSGEMERTLSVLDYAVLVISGPDGIQAHTLTLLDLLKRYGIPYFIWVNKMDICKRSEEDIFAELQKNIPAAVKACELGGEAVAMVDESALEEFLESGSVSSNTAARLIYERKLVPCYFGSALKLDNVEALLDGVDLYTEGFPCGEKTEQTGGNFSAKVFKITHDQQENKLSWMKISEGSLSVRDMIGSEKVSQIRLYSGEKFEAPQTVYPGQVAAVLGLEETYTGQGIGNEADAPLTSLQPVLSYRIGLPSGCDPSEAYRKLSVLGEEDPLLRIVWNPQLREIQAQLMGEVQIDVLKQTISERFGMDVNIETGRIMYRETIASSVLGMGHFEPLRHYAEVHLLIEPLPYGYGTVFETAVPTDVLDINWQRLILTHLAEKQHLGVLTGSPLTDVKITLVAGRAHLKHTEGGDFRQATYRAVRQGLMKAENVLLEPFYAFQLEVPSDQIGRAISDIKAMGAQFESPQDLGDSMRITGKAPVSEMNDYQISLLSYTKGRGKLACRYDGYYPCHNTEKVIEQLAYEPERDVENTADSVFCSHGAGVNVKWNVSSQFMHLDSGIRLGAEVTEEIPEHKIKAASNTDFDDRELEAIMQREFGEIKRPRYSKVTYGDIAAAKPQEKILSDYVIVDGYNMIFSWDELKKLAGQSVALARLRLTELLVNYRAFRGSELVLVFDGYKVADNPGTKEDKDGIHLVYTKEHESADAYIEKLIREIGKNYRISVASSDGLIQLASLRSGVKRMSAKELEYEVKLAYEQMEDIIKTQNSGRFTLADSAKMRYN